MLTGFLPKFTLPSGVTDDRRGDGVAMICDGVSMLIDGFEGGEPTNGLKSWLVSKGVSDIDIAVLTHGHYDHYHGLQLIEEDERFHIKVLYCYDPETLRHGVDNTANGRAVKSDIANMYNFINTMKSHGTKVIFINHGGTIKCGGIAWKIYRKQPTTFTHLDGGEAYAFLNDGSLVLYSPEVRCIFGGDGPNALKDAIAYFNDKVVFYDVSHHGNACSESNAIALKNAGCILAWQSCIERNGVGTTNWTAYGSRRVKEQGIKVWQQNVDVTFTAGGGKITFRHGSNVISADVPYQGSTKEGWVTDSKGTWYRFADGTWAIGWQYLALKGKSYWFYFDYQGYAVHGWQYLMWSKGKSWFFFNYKTGEMLIGWQTLPWGDGKTDEFYLDPKNGNLIYGWQWLEKSGKKSWFYLDDKNGNMHKGWVFVAKSWYFLDDKDGRMQTGWLNRNGMFYLEPKSGNNQGHAYRNQTAVIDGKTYTFDANCYAKLISENVIPISSGRPDIKQNPNFKGYNVSNRNDPIMYIVVHYTGAEGTAKNNIDYFNGGNRNASADYFIGHDGEIWQYNPDLKRYYSWHCGGGRQSSKGGKFYGMCKNANSIGIELCTHKQNGEWIFYDATINAARILVRYLMETYNIKQANVIRHYDVNGKNCPAVYGYAGDNAPKWDKFKASLSESTHYDDTPQIYRVRKSWAEADTQKGAFAKLENAKACASNWSGYHVFDSNGNMIM